MTSKFWLKHKSWYIIDISNQLYSFDISGILPKMKASYDIDGQAHLTYSDTMMIMVDSMTESFRRWPSLAQCWLRVGNQDGRHSYRFHQGFFYRRALDHRWITHKGTGYYLKPLKMHVVEVSA